MGALTIGDFSGGINFAATPLALKTGTVDAPLESGLVQDVDYSHPSGVLTRKGLGLGPVFSIPSEYITSQATAQGTNAPNTQLTTAGGQPFVVQPGVELQIGTYVPTVLARSGVPYHLTSTLAFSGAIQYAVAEVWQGNPSGPTGLEFASNPVCTLCGLQQVFTFPAATSINGPLWLIIRFLPTTTGILSYLADTLHNTGTIRTSNGGVSLGPWLALPAGQAPAFTSLTGPAYATSGVGGPITGLYDFRSGAPVTQTVLATSTVSGTLAWSDTSSAFAAITCPGIAANTGHGQQDFCTSNNYAFIFGLDSGAPFVWDQISAAAMRMGWRPTPANKVKASSNVYAISALAGHTATVASFSAISTTVYPWTFAGDTVAFYNASNNYLGYGSVVSVDTANNGITFADAIPSTATQISQGFAATSNLSSGSVAAGSYNVMLVTTLRSGGYRASVETVHFVVSASSKIQLSNLGFNSDPTGGTGYGFDVDPQATQVYIQVNTQSVATTLGISTGVYYQVPPAYLTWTHPAGSNVGNPVPNDTTNIVIANLTGLSSQNTLADTYNLPDAYFTMQMDAPAGLAYGRLYNGFLFTAGDPLNPNRAYASQYEAPNIFNRYGQTYGSYYEPATIGDGDHITGMHAWGGKFYIMRGQSIQMAYFTGNNAAPFVFSDVATTVGCISHYSVQDVPQGFVFLSPQGPAVCYGSYAMAVKAGWKIRNLFDSSITLADVIGASSTIAATPYSLPLISGQSWSSCSSGIDEQKMQIYWCLGHAGDTIPSVQLVYDYQAGSFFERNLPVQVCTSVLQATGVKSLWFGGILGVVTILDGANTQFPMSHPYADQFIYLADPLDTSAPNAGINTPIISVFDTPWMALGDVGGIVRLDRLNLSFNSYMPGFPSVTSSDVLVQEFSNYQPGAIAQRTYSDPTGQALFNTAFAGVVNPLVAQGNAVKLRFIVVRQSNAQTLINSAKVYFTPLGTQL